MEAVATGSGFPDKRKRADSSSEESGTSKRRMTWYYVLGSESETETERTESIYSIQQKSTDCAKDTSDTSTKSSCSDMVQFEVLSFSEDEQLNPFPHNNDSSSAPEDTLPSSTFLLSTISDSDSFADTSSLNSVLDEIDPELSRADFWTCIQCKEQNNNPMFRYCERCFKVRKNFFPPRPRHKKPRRRPRKRTNRNKESQPSSSGIGSSLDTASLEPSQETISETPKFECLPKLEDSEPNKNNCEMCETCFRCPKDGGYVHGNIVHVYNCYKCAVKILKQRGSCPICNSKVRQVVKVIIF